MSLFAKVFRKYCAALRVSFYRALSNAKVHGKFKAVTPVLCQGRGQVFVGERTSFGFAEDADYWTSYVFLNPRKPESRISIGNDCQICNHFTAIAEGEGIEIGDRVLVGTQVSVFDSDFHEIDPERRLGGTPKTGKVVIGDNVWIGDRVTILKGSKIGQNTVVAAGAVVAGVFPANAVIGGVPAKIIR